MAEEEPVPGTPGPRVLPHPLTSSSVPARYLALLNALGFTTPDALEDFIFVHGPCLVLPPSALPDAAVLETQSDPHSPSRASRYEARKAELAAALASVTRLKKELAYEKSERAKSDIARDRAQELLDGLCDGNRDLLKKLERTTVPEEVTWLRAKVGVCERVIEEVECENEVLRRELGIAPDDVVFAPAPARGEIEDLSVDKNGLVAERNDGDVTMEDIATTAELMCV